MLAQITGTETEILQRMLDTEAGRLIGLALVLMCGTMLYTVISSSRFNARLLTMTGGAAAALDRNTAQLKNQDNRVDEFVQRDFQYREQHIVAMGATTEMMREYTAAFLELRGVLSQDVSTALAKHDQTHSSLHELKGAFETMKTAVTTLDSKITQEIKQPLDMIVNRLETLTGEMRLNNRSSRELTGRVEEALTLMQSAKQILQLAASRQRSTDEWKKVQSETNVANHTGDIPAADAGQPGTGGGSSTGRESILDLDERTPVVLPGRDHHRRVTDSQPGDDPTQK